MAAVTKDQVEAVFLRSQAASTPEAAMDALTDPATGLTPLFNSGGSAPGDTYITQAQGDARYRRIGVNIPASEIDGLPAAPSVVQFTIGDGNNHLSMLWRQRAIDNQQVAVVDSLIF